MPQRFLRPAITNSQRWNAVGFPEQSLYIRLLTIVDDYGRCDGRPAVIWGQCFAVWNEQHPEQAINLQQLVKMLQQLVAKRLIDAYKVEGKLVIQLLQWTERARQGVRERWPENPEPPRDLQQVAASCCILLPPSPSPSPSPPPSGTAPAVGEVLLLEIPPEPKPNGVWHPDQIHLRLGAIFHRKETTRWNKNELKALQAIMPIPEDDLQQIERYYAATIPKDDYRRHDLQTLLNNWNGELDRARNFKEDPGF